MKHTNPFNKLLWTARLAAVLRIILALGAIGYFGSLFSGLTTFILCSALTDFFFLRPIINDMFLNTSFSETDIDRLQQKQDISPEGFMLFFRDLLAFRAAFFLVAIIVGIVGWIANGLFWVYLAPLVYVVLFFIMFSSLQRMGGKLPKSYRPTSWTKSRGNRGDYDSLSNSSNVHSPLNPAHPMTRLRNTYWSDL